MANTKNYKRVYVWQFPVRIFHWTLALSIVVLSITGFLIAEPPAFMSNAEAFDTFWMGRIRVVHFIFAYLLFGAMVLRTYWAFVGNKFSHWKAFWPFTKKGIRNIIHVFKHDFFLLTGKNPKLSDISIGHNYLASTAYGAMFFTSTIMVLTGFGLYSNNATWWFPKMFIWVPSFFGGDFFTRQIHHFSMWILIIMVIVHVYAVLYHDWLEGRGEASAMISGFKFVRQERVHKGKIEENLEKDSGNIKDVKNQVKKNFVPYQKK